MDALVKLGPVLIPLAGIVVNLTGQMILSRLPLGFGHVRRQFIAFGAGLGTVVPAHLWMHPAQYRGWSDELGGFILVTLTYCFLGFVFFNALNANLSSLRIRILKELRHRHPRTMSEEELVTRYGEREILAIRLERLVSGRQLARRHDRYYLNPGAVAVIGRFFASLRRLLLDSRS